MKRLSNARLRSQRDLHARVTIVTMNPWCVTVQRFKGRFTKKDVAFLPIREAG